MLVIAEMYELHLCLVINYKFPRLMWAFSVGHKLFPNQVDCSRKASYPQVIGKYSSYLKWPVCPQLWHYPSKAKDVQKTQSICCIITNISDVIFTLSSFSHSVIADGLSLIVFFNPCCRAMFMLYRQKLCQALRTGALKVREQCMYLQ